MQNLIKTVIAKQLIGTQVSLTMGSLRTIDVFILGAAKKPGMYSISALSNITNAIFQGGGIDTSGSLRDIKLKRDGQTIASLDLYDLFLNGDTSNDRRLMQGDVVFIEPIGKTAGVRGEINRPSIYEIKDDETLGQLLRFAGNMKPKANKSNVELTRINQTSNSFELIKLDLESSEQMDLNNGDMVNIYPVNDNMQNAVLVSGHVPQSGFYAWKENMKILDLFRSSNDLLRMTDLNYVLIKSLDQSSQKYFFRQADLEKAFRDPSSSENIILFDQDEILLLPSLLSPTLITTRLIKDKPFNNEETEDSLTEEEWTSLTYLRRSFQEDRESKINNNNDEDLDFQYYEYSIYNYCDVPTALVLRLINETLVEDLAQPLTMECRKQLLEPMLAIAKKDNSTDELSTIDIFGGVYFPGSYPYTEEMSLSDAIKASGGAMDGIYTSEVEINVRDNEGNKFVTKGSYASISEADKIDLSKQDVVVVKKLKNELKTVKISGEVYFPGTYPIADSETLAELMMRAGGPTENSDLNAAVFLREALAEAERKRIRMANDELQRKLFLSNSSSLGEEGMGQSEIQEIQSLIQEAADLESLGRLVIDLEQIMSSPINDIELEAGDSLYIPSKQQTISVIGEVYVPNNHIYVDDLSLEKYISLSGGYTDFADDNSIYVIKSNGSILSQSEISSGFFRSDNYLQPGDTIVVPLKVTSFSQLRAATEITQIIYQMAIAAAAVNSF